MVAVLRRTLCVEEAAVLPDLWRDRRFGLLLLLTLLLLGMAYQVRLPTAVNVGAFGDRAFLWASPLQADSGFNGDEHLIAEGLDYRWTKHVSWVRFRDLGWNGPISVSLRLRGWRPEGQGPPWVEVWVNGVFGGRFQASGEWEERAFRFDEYPGRPADIEVLVETSPFNPGGEDKRFLGVQLDWVRLEPLPGGTSPVRPPWQQLVLWTAVIALLYAGLRRRFSRGAFWAGLVLSVAVATGLIVCRHWLTAFAVWSLYAAGGLCLLAYADHVVHGLQRWSRRARSLPFYFSLVLVAVSVLLAFIRWAVGAVPKLGPRPDAILLVVFVAAAVLYALLTWDRPLRRLLNRVDESLRGPWLAGILLAILLVGLTVYEFTYIREMQFIGHADYADNGVVARNLLAGRGYAVDYVTQFFQPYSDLSHPQETWPLLQPTLIAPFFALFGESAFVAKLPNLLLQLALAVGLYAVGRRVFDRRVALVAVILTLLNPFIFRLVIFPTSDLAFTLFALLTLAQFFRASETEREGTFRWGSYAWAGVWAGLMMLAKPNGVLFTGTCLLWDLLWRFRERRWQGWWRSWLAFGVPAAVLFAPWVVRNLVLFGSPIHSTESSDAWILKYQEWEEIYRIYFDDVPDRSWLLRHGFDRVMQAMGTEFRKWWHYFSRDANALLTLIGSALALGGALTLRRRAARLFSLVGLTLVLFGTFICTYWHVEERYFIPFIPWLALLAARMLWWLYDALAYRRNRQGRPRGTGFAWLGLAAVVLACLQITAPFSQEAKAKQEVDRMKGEEMQAYTWLAENSDPDDVIMTRVPWQVTFYTGRRTVMIPQDGLEDAERIAELYGVRFLLMDGDARGKRAALNRAVQARDVAELVYDQGGVQIYAFPVEP
jgi:hypothetical protein